MTYGFAEPESEHHSSELFPSDQPSIDNVIEEVQEKPKVRLWEKSVTALNRLTVVTGVTLMGAAGVKGFYSLWAGYPYSNDIEMLFGIGLGLLYASTIGHEAGQIYKKKNDS